MTNREAGINVVREMMGDQAAAKLSASADSNTFGAPIAAYAVDQVFADIWTRPDLDRRSRSLVSMSVMIAMHQPHEFAIHMWAGLNNGLTLKEIEEVLIQALPCRNRQRRWWRQRECMWRLCVCRRCTTRASRGW
jgi:4-carboxymuconolactone decarboxylase